MTSTERGPAPPSRSGRGGALALAVAIAAGVAYAPRAEAQTAQAAQPQDPTRMAAAQQRFERALGLFDRSEWAPALAEFRASLDLYPSPNTRLYVGLCLQRLGRLAEAHTELQRTYNEARHRAETDPNYADARDASEHELAGLRARLGRLVVRLQTPAPGATIQAGSSEILPAMLGLPLHFDPGEITVSALAPGYRAFQRRVRLAPNATTEVVVTLQADPHVMRTPPASASSSAVIPTAPGAPERVTGGGVRTAGLVVGAVGLAGVGAFALLANMAGTRFDEVQTRCGGRCRTAAYEADIDEGETLQLLANVSLGVGVAAVVTGTIMIAVGGPRIVAGEEPRRASRVRPWADVARGAVGVSGAF